MISHVITFSSISLKDFRFLSLEIIIGLTLRILFNNLIYSKDAESFVFWGIYLKSNSIASLYESLPGGFTPLPPFYYYISRFLANLSDLLGLLENQWATYLIFKIPPILSETVIAILIYWFVKKYLNSKWAIASSAFYFLHPAVIYNTAIFGQIDSFVVSLAFIAIILIVIKKYAVALFIYSLGVLSKLQDLGVFPLVVFLSLVSVPVKKQIIAAIVVLAISFVSLLPILTDKGLVWTVLYFKELPSWYPYTSVYTYNLWAFTGFLTPDKTKFLSFVPYRFLGLFTYLLVAVLIIWPLLQKKNRTAAVILFAALLLFFDFAFFSTRIHSRYLIYSLPFAAPFIAVFPLSVLALSVLIILNLMLPMSYGSIKEVIAFLNWRPTIFFSSLSGLVLFSIFLNNYRKLLENK